MIKYIKGDATSPSGDGRKIIAHVCNDIGGWGRGFVLSLSQRFPTAEHAYRRWAQEDVPPGQAGSALPFKLGEVQLVKVDDVSEIYVANMIGQHGIFPDGGVPPIRYDSLEKCLRVVRACARVLNASVHMPRIGCGLAGGKWSEVEPIIERALEGVETYVYDFDTGDARTVPWK